MQNKKLKVYFKLYWIRIVIIAVIILTSILTLILLGVGLYHFLTIESFYRKMSWSSIPFTIFFWLVIGTISAAIHSIIWIYFVFGGGFAKLGRKKVEPTEVNIKWKDVVGMEAVKEEVWEVISLLKDRAQVKLIGGKIIKGVLMIGPPGCGKTYLAKAIATETGLPFLAGVGSEFIGTFVGMGASKLRSLFKQARAYAELHGGCIVFIDEIDTIARPRTGISGYGAGIDYNATVNQLLTEMDGLRQTENNIIVIAATNVPEYQLDPALMRAGRFDRKIYVGRPGLEDRKKLFDYYLNKVEHDSSIDTSLLARRALWFSAADIANMVREASLIAVRNRRQKIAYKDLSEAYDRVIFGLKSHLIISEREKLWTAYHEAGHAIIAYLTHPTDDVVKATIIPRKGFLGFVAHHPQEEIYTHTKNWFLASIKTSLGGYVAEKLKFGTTSSGVSQDFQNALSIAHSMAFRYGMGPSGYLGNFDVLSSDSSGAFDDYQYGWRYRLSEETKRKIEDDTQKILQECLKEVEEILTRERELLDHFAQELVKKGELEYDEIVEIFKKYGKERPQEKYF